MKLLLDENLPHQLRLELPGHEVITVAYMNWSGVFAELINTVETCSLGQITEALHATVGHYRPTV